ncbi:hypothetical protein N9230_06635 [Akkermansiaceae bacterium]|nr:hypothetical protein [Akkermansiaceae bacterium]
MRFVEAAPVRRTAVTTVGAGAAGLTCEEQETRDRKGTRIRLTVFMCWENSTNWNGRKDNAAKTALLRRENGVLLGRGGLKVGNPRSIGRESSSLEAHQLEARIANHGGISTP